MDISGTALKPLAEQHGAEYVATDIDEVLEDEKVDVVVVTTRHDKHAPYAIAAADAGKAVFVEKPMGLSEEECRDVLDAVERNEVAYAVGFNRRFAPTAVRAKEVLDGLPGQTVIDIRVNGGAWPLDNWVYDPEEGGGRIVGEACHFFDLANFFAGSRPVRIQAASIGSDRKDVLGEDNFTVSIEYEDGDLATILYTSVGSSDYPKEKIELLKGGVVITIDDFVELKVHGSPEKGLKHKVQDKGHRNELIEFAMVLKGGKPSLTLDDCLSASLISFQVRELLKGKKTED